MTSLDRWMTYLKERSPLPVLAFIGAGIACSGMAFRETFDPFLLVLGIVFSVMVLVQMRLGDEIKDFEKDKVMHPTRPLPRGLLTVDQVFRGLLFILIVIVIAGIALGITRSWWGGLSLISTTIFAWLMFKEFYVGHFLAKEPMTYAITHQVIVFPIHAWVGLSLDPTLINHTPFLGWLLANFGASFTFEICRKLDPNAHQLAGTYAHHYGRHLTAVFITVFLAISAYGAMLAGYEKAAWPLLALIWLMVVYWTRKPEIFKGIEGLTALSSTIILWTPAVKWLISKWS